MVAPVPATETSKVFYYRLTRNYAPLDCSQWGVSRQTKRQLRFAGVREKFSGWGYDRAKALRPL
jgi:hypothetical protein